MNKGKIKQIIGAVLDVEFTSGNLPNIYNAVEVYNEARKEKLIMEVQQHLGNNLVRCIALGSSDGLKRDIEVIDTGAPISVPVGKNVLGRLLNVLG